VAPEFIAHDSVKKELLATALLAMSNRLMVEAWLPSTDPHSVVHGIFPELERIPE